MLEKLFVFVIFFIQLSASQDCDAPGHYPNALLSSNAKTKYSPGDRVQYRCAFGYKRVSGSPFVRCAEGLWTRLSMKCERKSCGSAGEILNGYFEYMDQEALFGDVVVAMCQEGYRLKGNRYRQCQDSGWDRGIPSCEEGVEITCPNPSVTHGVKIKGDAAVYSRGYNVSFICTDQFSLRGPGEITCGADGKWHPNIPKCVPSNASDSCSSPPNYPTMILADQYLLEKDFPPGSQVRYTCGVGYRRSRGNIFISHCEEQQWTPINLKCERKSCGSAGEILNGHYEYSGILFGDTASAVCRDGYVLIGRSYRQCQDQGWDGKTPVCEAVKCADPPEVVNGERTGEPEGPFDYSTVLHYRCRQGQLIGQREIYCTRDGTWSAPPPECLDITCSYPSVNFGRMASGPRRLFKYREYASLQCKEGYRLNGTSRVMCGRTGQWTPQLPQCSAVTCSRPNITFAASINGKEFKYGQSMIITCQRHYKLRGPKKISCGSSGQWTPQLPECYKNCPRLPMRYGVYSYEQINGGKDISIQCSRGYTLKGAAVITCLKNGTWHPNTPICVRQR